jgi:hypothetical protein
VKSWCIGKPSPGYVAKMEDVLDVYQRPYDAQHPVICLDESGKALQATPRGQLPIRRGQPQRQDYEYQRRGACNVNWRKPISRTPNGLCWSPTI